jgi:GT2 family glycosyltransferase/peptidoglycan/LPS O-acetylase OafA/YrhL
VTRVGVIIVNKNAGSHLAQTLESLARQTTAPHRVIVVDNASDDGSVDGLDARFPKFEIVRSSENLGFAAGNNLALRMCGDCELVALLNPDAFPEPDWLATLVAAAADHPECAVFGSKLVLAGDRSTLDGTGDQYHVSGLAWRRDQGASVDVARERGETFSACAAAALYRRDALVAVGGLDESFFCYYEDTDLAFRLRLAGHRSMYVPEAVALHVGSATTGALSAFTIYHSARNQLWTYVKNMPGPLFWLYLPQHIFVSFLTVFAYTLHGRGGAALAGKRDAVRDLPRVLAERRRIQAARVVSSREMRAAMSRGMTGYVETFSSRFRTRQTTDLPPRRAHLRHLDGMRGLAALFVVLHHTWLTVWPNVEGTPVEPIGKATRFLAFGHFAVVVFIVLSGFCLSIPVARSSGLAGGAGRFFRSRARRLLPPYYASFALSLVLVWTLIGRRTGTHWDISVPVDWHGYLGNGLMLGDVLGGGQLNHVWWSVALEWQIYLAFPFLVGCWLAFGAGPATALGWMLAGAAWLTVTLVPSVGPVHLAGALPWFLALFSLGMLAAAIVETDAPRMRSLRSWRRWNAAALLAWLGVVAVCVAEGRSRVFSHLGPVDLAVGVAAACAIVASSRSEGRLSRVFGWRPLVFVGGFSYSLYLIHAPLLQVIWQYDVNPLALGPSATFLLMLLVGVPAVVGGSYVFFLLFERPFLSPAHRARIGAGARPRRRSQPGPTTPQAAAAGRR